MVKLSQVSNGIVSFAEAEILPAMDGWQLWVSSATLALLYKRADTVLAELANNKATLALGISDGKGNIDVDAAVEALKETARTRGKLELDLSVFGKFKLGENDFDTLKEHILKAE